MRKLFISAASAAPALVPSALQAQALLKERFARGEISKFSIDQRTITVRMSGCHNGEILGGPYKPPFWR